MHGRKGGWRGEFGMWRGGEDSEDVGRYSGTTASSADERGRERGVNAWKKKEGEREVMP